LSVPLLVRAATGPIAEYCSVEFAGAVVVGGVVVDGGTVVVGGVVVGGVVATGRVVAGPPLVPIVVGGDAAVIVVVGFVEGDERLRETALIGADVVGLVAADVFDGDGFVGSAYGSWAVAAGWLASIAAALTRIVDAASSLAVAGAAMSIPVMAAAATAVVPALATLPSAYPHASGALALAVNALPMKGTCANDASAPPARRSFGIEMLRKARTMSGLKWVPVHLVSSARAAARGIADLYERTAVITSKESATATIVAARGMSSPAS